MVVIQNIGADCLLSASLGFCLIFVQMATIREKRNSVPMLGNEPVAAKRRHASSVLNGKENLVPRSRPSGAKRPKISQVYVR